MEFTISRINKQNKLLVSKKTTERFLERIAKDDAKQSVQNFRMSAPLMNGNYEYYNGMREWRHVMPVAEFDKDESDNLVFQTFNGLAMLVFDQLSNHAAIAHAKQAASYLPMTFAAIEGADGRSLIVLVCVRDERATCPTRNLMPHNSINMPTNKPDSSTRHSSAFLQRQRNPV